MSELLRHAKRELELAGFFDKEGLYDGELGKAVMALMETFSKQGHSGMSASMTLELFTKLAKYEPLVPLSGADHEWGEVDKGLWQNNRCSRVFKNDKGEAWDIYGKVFEEPDGMRYTGAGSKTPVTFPYTPSDPEIVKVDEEGNAV